MVKLRAFLAAIRDDVLVWSGIALIAWTIAQFHAPLAVGLVGVALVLDGLFGGRRR